MKTSHFRAAIAALAIATGPVLGQPALAQEAPPPTAQGQPPGPPRGPRMMPEIGRAHV